MWLMSFIHQLKLTFYPLIYRNACIDNSKIGKSANAITLPDEPIEPSFVRNTIVSIQGDVLDDAKSNVFTPPCLERFSDVEIDLPYGLAYVGGKLICPPGLPLNSLFEHFPMRAHLTPSSEQCEQNLKVEAFYLIGPTCHNYYHWVIDKLIMLRSYIYYRDTSTANISCYVLTSHTQLFIRCCLVLACRRRTFCPGRIKKFELKV